MGCKMKLTQLIHQISKGFILLLFLFLFAVNGHAESKKDTLVYNTPDTIIIKPFVPKEVYKPSKFVFTEKDGNVKIVLPLATEKKYTIKFFDEFSIPVFEIKQIKYSILTLDKSNFIHFGWYKFELYEDGVLKEKNKLFVPKDF